MASPEMRVEIHLRWWFAAYLQVVGFLCFMFEREPDWDRVLYWFERGIVVRINGRRYTRHRDRRRFRSRSW